jgi:hypothetical protein
MENSSADAVPFACFSVISIHWRDIGYASFAALQHFGSYWGHGGH